jgi:hypothetical protein
MSYTTTFLYTPCQHALNTLPLLILPSDVPRHQPCNPTAGLHEEQSCVARCRSRVLWAINVRTPLRLRLYPRCICWATVWSNKRSGAETESVARGDWVGEWPVWEGVGSAYGIAYYVDYTWARAAGLRSVSWAIIRRRLSARRFWPCLFWLVMHADRRAVHTKDT